MMRSLTFCAVLFVSLPVQADPPGKKRPPRVAQGDAVKCTVRCIHAHQRPGGIDKRLTFLRKQLARPPFSAFKSFELLSVKVLDIPRAVTRDAPLPTKKVLRLTFKDKLLVGKKVKLRIHLSIKSKLNTVYTIVDRGTMLVAGDKYKDGILVVGTTCAAK